MRRLLSDDATLRGLLGSVREEPPSELMRRACARIDRRSGAGMRRGGRGSGGSRADVVDNLLYAVTGFSAASYYATQTGGGEAGDAGGFVTVLMTQLLSIPTSNQKIFNRTNVAQSEGWQHYAIGADVRGSLVGTPNFVPTASDRLNPSDVGKIHLYMLQYTGSMGRFLARRGLVQEAAITAYVPAAGGAMVSGARLGGLEPGTAFAHLAWATFRGAPSVAQLQAYCDAARLLGDLPEQMDGAVCTHHHPVKRTLRGVSNPTGRRTYGVRGVSGTASLQTASGTGVPGSAGGMWIAWYGKPDSLVTAGAAALLECFDNVSSPNHGWTLQTGSANYATMRFGVMDAAGTFYPSSSFALADAGNPQLIVGVFTGTHVRIYYKRAQVGTDQAATLQPPSGRATSIGRRQTGILVAENLTHFGASGGNVSLSADEVFQLFDDVERTGTIQQVPGKTAWCVDLSAAIAANGGALPASFPDSAGSGTVTPSGALAATYHVASAPPAPLSIPDTITTAPADAMARVGSPSVVVIDPSIDGRKTLGVQGFATTAYLASANDQGIRGSSVAFNAKWYGRIDALSSLVQLLMSASTAGGNGWQLYLSSGGVVTATMRVVTPATIIANSPSNTFVAGDAAQPQLIIVQVRNGMLQVWAKGSKVAETAVTAAISQGPQPFTIGIRASLDLPATAVSWFEAEGSDTQALTDEEIALCFAETARLGKLYSIKAEHRWSGGEDIIANGGVDNGVPAVFADRIGSHPLSRVGTDLTVAQRVERLWSYERAPIVYGANDHSTTAYWQSADGLRGHAAGFWFALWFIPHVVTVSNNRLFAGAASASDGWDVRTAGTNTVINWFMYDDAGVNNASPNSVINTTDLERMQLYVGQWDGAKQRAYFKRTETGAGTARTGCKPSTTAMQLGRSPSQPGIPGTGITILGFAAGSNCALSLAEVQALFDDVQANERMRGVRSKTDMLFDWSLDVLGNGGALPAVALDRVAGAHNCTRVGAPTLTARHARAWGW